MTIESAADRLAMLADWDSAVFGADTISGVFDNKFVEVNGVEDVHPVFTCRTADVPGVAQGSAITVNGTAYTVVGVQPDGTGMSMLLLEVV